MNRKSWKFPALQSVHNVLWWNTARWKTQTWVFVRGVATTKCSFDLTIRIQYSHITRHFLYCVLSILDSNLLIQSAAKPYTALYDMDILLATAKKGRPKKTRWILSWNIKKNGSLLDKKAFRCILSGRCPQRQAACFLPLYIISPK